MAPKHGIMMILLTALVCGSALGAPTIGSISDSGSQIPRYDKYEASFSIGGVGTAGTDYNPYNPNLTSAGSAWYQKQGIYVDALITKPDGTSARWPCFWDGSTWKFRFAPTATGTWSYQILVKHSSGSVTSSSKSFTCVASDNKGFVSVDPSDTRFFRYSNGEPFYPLGVCVSGGGSINDVDGAFPLMGENGANYTRVFRASYQLEQTGASMLNNYAQSRCQWHDNLMEKGRQYGIHIQLLVDDWTRWKGTENPYIAQGIVSSVDTLWTNATCIEVYKRKLRYMLARWGYATSFMGFDLINEVGGGDANAKNFHKKMGDFTHGVTSEVPSGWGGGGQVFAYNAQPHLCTGDETSTNLRVAFVPWDDPSTDLVNYHDYCRPSIGWGGPNGTYHYDKMGSTIDYIWKDTGVWMDRLCRVYKRYSWSNKPFSWTEFGLITGSWADDTANYTADTGGRHFKDAVWAGIFSLGSITHWKQAYIVGDYGGGGKWWIHKPCSNYLAGEDLRGLTQETYYPVADTLNTSPKITCTNGNIMIIALRGTNKAYFYVKNLTDTWWRACGHTDGVPTPASQTGTMQLKGLQPGTYTVEKWSTKDTNAATQKKSTETKTVGSDGILTVSLSVSTGTDFDWAYKVKPSGGTPSQPKLSCTLSTDKTKVAPGGTVTYTVNYTNTGAGAATNVAISMPLPANTTFVSASNGGTYNSTTKKVSWTITSCAAGAGGSVTFQAKVN